MNLSSIRLLLAIVIFLGACYGESPQVKITFLMDGKLKPAPKFIEFQTEAGDLIAQVEIIDGKFNVPPKALLEPVIVVFQFQGRRLVFPDVYPIRFRSPAWEVGIKHPPFDPDDDLYNKRPGKKPIEDQFIKFNDGMRMDELVYKK
jgi:hypothetical protein